MITQESLEKMLEIEQFKYFEAKGRGVDLDEHWERLNTLSKVLDDLQLYSQIEEIAQKRYFAIYESGQAELNAQIKRASIQAGFWWANKLDEQYETRRCTFAENLSLLIEEKLSEIALDRSQRLRTKICCDYDPDELLLSALHKSSIFPQGIAHTCDGILPRKHVLIVYPDRLEAREGYQPWSEPILVSESETHAKARKA